MPQWDPAADMTTANLPNLGGSGRQAFRVTNAINTYLPGTVLQLAAVDSQILPDFQTVVISAAAATGTKLAGVVIDAWGGFDNASGLNASYTSIATQTNVAGTQFLIAKVKGINYVFLDQSAGVTVTDGIPLTTSANTAGYAQGIAKSGSLGASTLGVANLPAAGIGSSLTQAALAQASQTWTVTGTPAAGDVLTATIQAPYTDLQPGTVQTYAVSVTLNATTAASVTTAAAALAAALNASQYFQVQSLQGAGNPPPYFTAASAAGVVTVTVNNLANPFLVTGGTTTLAGSALEQWRFFTSISGMVANSLTTTASTSAGSGSILTAGGATFSGGTGFKGKVPALIYGMY